MLLFPMVTGIERGLMEVLAKNPKVAQYIGVCQ